ncbi:Uncharacterised protein [uncultured archaeon]|nr:Uncharacterised protein [uncultured archaeon]
MTGLFGKGYGFLGLAKETAKKTGWVLMGISLILALIFSTQQYPMSSMFTPLAVFMSGLMIYWTGN